MARLINTKALMKRIDRYPPYIRDVVKKELRYVPTVKVVSVKQGHWAHGKELSRDYVGDVCSSIHYDGWWCSECGYHFEGKPLWKYCPNCGAVMEVKE